MDRAGPKTRNKRRLLALPKTSGEELNKNGGTNEALSDGAIVGATDGENTNNTKQHMKLV